MLSTFCAFDIISSVNSLQVHLTFIMVDRADVLKLTIPCINASMKPDIFFSFSWCFLQTTQNIFTSSENCGQFHFSFYFLIVLGFGRDLELEVIVYVLSLNIVLFKNVIKKVKLIFPLRINSPL